MATKMKDTDFKKLLAEKGKSILQPPKLKKVGEKGYGQYKENIYEQTGGGMGTIETEIAYYAINGTTYKKWYRDSLSGITMYVNKIKDVGSAGKAIKHAAAYTNDNLDNGYELVKFRLRYSPITVAEIQAKLCFDWMTRDKNRLNPGIIFSTSLFKGRKPHPDVVDSLKFWEYKIDPNRYYVRNECLWHRGWKKDSIVSLTPSKKWDIITQAVFDYEYAKKLVYA